MLESNLENLRIKNKGKGLKKPWMEEPGRLQSMGPLRVGQD